MDLEHGHQSSPTSTPTDSGSPSYPGLSGVRSPSPARQGHRASTSRGNLSTSDLQTGEYNLSPLLASRHNLGTNVVGTTSMFFDAHAPPSLQDDPSWDEYVKRAQELDKEMLATWTTSMDTLLVFAGLFSAILTAFIAVSIPSLRPSSTQSNAPSSPPINSSNVVDALADSAPTTRVVLTHFCWLLSLSLSILTAAAAMLAKSWCLEYSRQSSAGSRFEQARRRQARYTGLVAWRLPEVMDIIPSLLYLAIILFMIGLCEFLADLHMGIAIAVFVLFSLGLVIGIGVSILAAVISDCPYRTPFIPIITRIAKAILPRPIVVLVRLLTLCVKRVFSRARQRCSNTFHRLTHARDHFIHGMTNFMHRWSSALRHANGRFSKGSLNSRNIITLCTWPIFRFIEVFFIIGYGLKWLWEDGVCTTSLEMEEEKNGLVAKRAGSWNLQSIVGGSGHEAEALGWLIESSGDPYKVTKALTLLPSVLRTANDRRVLIEAGAAHQLSRSMAAIYGDGQGRSEMKDSELCRLGNALRFLLGSHPDAITSPSLRRDINMTLSPCLHYLSVHRDRGYQVLGVSLQTCLSSETDFSYDMRLVDTNQPSPLDALLLLHCALDTVRRRYYRSRTPAFVARVRQTDFSHITFINALLRAMQVPAITEDMASAYLHALRYELTLTSKTVHTDEPSLPDLIISTIKCLDDVLSSSPAATLFPLMASATRPRHSGHAVIGRAVLVEAIVAILAIIRSVDISPAEPHHGDLKEYVLRQMRQRSTHHETQRHALLAFHKLVQSGSDYHGVAWHNVLNASTHVIEHPKPSPDDVVAAIDVLIQFCRRGRDLFTKSMLEGHHRLLGELAQQAEYSPIICEAILRLLDVMVDSGRPTPALHDLLTVLPVSRLVDLIFKALEQGHRSEKVVQFALIERLVRLPAWAQAMANHPTFLPHATHLLGGSSRTIRQLCARVVVNLWVVVCGTITSSDTSTPTGLCLTESQIQAWMTGLITSGFLHELTSRVPDLDLLSIPRIDEWIPQLRGLSQPYPEEHRRLLLALRTALDPIGGWKNVKRPILARECLALLQEL